MRITVGGALAGAPRLHVAVRALDHVNLELKAGDRVALIGHNGSGKTTLLRALAGAYEPDEGRIEVQGRIAALLSTPSGIDLRPPATTTSACGAASPASPLRDREEEGRDRRVHRLGPFLAMPVSTYSSGHADARLAFAAATAVEADVLLMDEWIAVGDALFVEKANRRINEFVSRAREFSCSRSHSPELLRKTCNKGLMLSHGKVVCTGTPEEVLAAYTG